MAWLTAILVLSACVLAPGAAGPDRTRPPNVILVMMDDLHYDDLGAYGSEFIRTPHIDQLAREGVRFTQFYAAGPVCTPSRAAILTGRYAHRFNLEIVVRERSGPGSEPSRRGIPGSVTTLAELLRARGYATGQFGKWHVGWFRPEYRPLAQGFERSLIGIERRGGLLVDDSVPSPVTGDFTDHLTERAIDYIRDNRDRPFFLDLWYSAPHVPVEPAPRWATRYPATENGRFAAMVSQLDENVGRVVAALDELDLARRTLILVTSDNGGRAVTHRESELRGFKAHLYEGGIRVPLIARWPGRTPAGAVDSSLVSGLDLLPTLADLLSVDVSDLPLDGLSFKTALLGEAASRRGRALFWEYGGTGAVRDRDAWAVRRSGWKLVHDKQRARLFDLASDPLETTDLAGNRPQLLAELTDAYRDWRLRDRRLGYEVESTLADVVLEAGLMLGREARGAIRTAVFSRPGSSVTLLGEPLFDFHEGDFTLGLWLKVDTDPLGHGRVIARQAGSWQLAADRDGKLTLTITGDPAGRAMLRSSARIEPGRWHHIAFSVFGRPHDTSLVRLYLDGELQRIDESLEAVLSSADAIVLGGDEVAPLLGEVRDLRLYLMALTGEEAGRLFAGGAGPAS